jgi:hypothetical protein
MIEERKPMVTSLRSQYEHQAPSNVASVGDFEELMSSCCRAMRQLKDWSVDIADKARVARTLDVDPFRHLRTNGASFSTLTKLPSGDLVGASTYSLPMPHAAGYDNGNGAHPPSNGGGTGGGGGSASLLASPDYTAPSTAQHVVSAEATYETQEEPPRKAHRTERERSRSRHASQDAVGENERDYTLQHEEQHATAHPLLA